MNHDDIVRMACEAGLWPAVTNNTFPKELELFAALVAETERDAFLKIADKELYNAACNIADAIRARGEK